MNRVLTVLYIVFCFELGVFLLILPWISLWNDNFFVSHYPWLSSLTRNYFLRGAISGIGVADLILAVWELWRSRQLLGLVHTRPSR